MKRVPLCTYHREAIERLALQHALGSGVLMDDDGMGVTAWNWEQPDGPTETPLALTVFCYEQEEGDE